MIQKLDCHLESKMDEECYIIYTRFLTLNLSGDLVLSVRFLSAK